MYLAQKVNIGGKEIEGQLQLPGGAELTVGGLISVILPFVITLCSILLFFILVWAGYDFMMSRGDPGRIKAARAKITYAVVGFILLVLSYFIVNLISYVFNVGGGLFGR